MSHWTPALELSASEESAAFPDEQASRFIRLPSGVWGIFLAAAGLGLLAPNPILTAASILVLPVFATLLWREGETPVLLFAIGFQWIQVTAKVFHADLLGVRVTLLSASPAVETAVWLSLIGLVVLSLGMRVGMRALRKATGDRAQVEAERFSVDGAFWFYVGGFVFSELARQLADVAKQLADGLTILHWVGFFLFAYVSLRQRQRLLLLLAVIGFEFVMGIGFFSGFKTILFVTLIVYFTARPTLKTSTLLSGGTIIVALAIFGSAWTIVKRDYRLFLSGGEDSQGVVVSQGEALAYLVDSVSALSGEDLVAGFVPMFERISYVDYFASTIEYVPSVLPHENGDLWKTAVLHVLQPRLLFPGKPPLPSDSDVTAYYTGFYVANEGTSVSIGYMGESYIDFGRVGMFAPILLIGILWGLLYAYFLRKSTYVLIGYAFATALLVNAYQLEIASIKLLGSILAKFIVLAILLRYLEPSIERWLLGEAAYDDEPETQPASP